VRIITETGLRVYRELMPMQKEQLDLANAMVWIPDSKTPNGVAEILLTPLALLLADEKKREALEKLNRCANEMSAHEAGDPKCTVVVE
jgi:hypothetical protein